MKRLLSIELQKLLKNKTSKFLSIAYFGILSSIALIISIKFDIGMFHFDVAEMGIFNFPFIWHFNVWIASFFTMFLAIIIVSMMSNEYSNGTLKQNLIDGLSKKEFIVSKFLTVILLSLASTFFLFIMSLILGYMHSSYTEFNIVFSDLEYLLGYSINLIGFFSFCLFLGILIKRSAFALGFLILWKLFEGVCLLLLKYFVFDTWEAANKFLGYFPLESMSNLIPNPWMRLSIIKSGMKQIGEDTNYDYQVHFSSILIVLCWTAIFVFSSYKILQKRDL